MQRRGAVDDGSPSGGLPTRAEAAQQALPADAVNARRFVYGFLARAAEARRYAAYRHVL